MMACEVQVERAFAFMFGKRSLEDLGEVVTAQFPSYSLSNERVRAVYVSLSGDSIQDAPFWADYKTAASKRNRIVHRGEPPMMTRPQLALRPKLLLNTLRARLNEQNTGCLISGCSRRHRRDLLGEHRRAAAEPRSLAGHDSERHSAVYEEQDVLSVLASFVVAVTLGSPSDAAQAASRTPPA
jgi:hypothetical protein